jgi:hypothetical protein
MVASSTLKLLQPGRPISEDGVILIGVASYAVLDLELLDRLDQSTLRWSGQFSIYVFDIANLRSIDDLQFYLMSVPSWFSPPGFKQWLEIKQRPIVLVSKAHEAIEFRQGVGPCQRLLEDLNVL